MSKTRIIRDEVFEGQDFDIRDLVTDKDGFALTNAVALGYGMRVYDLSNDMEEVFAIPSSSPLAGILFDEPITVGWDVNDTGYNFSQPISPDDWAVPQRGGHSYRFEILIDTSTLAGMVPVVAIVDVLAMESV